MKNNSIVSLKFDVKTPYDYNKDLNYDHYYNINGTKWNKDEGLIFENRYDYIHLNMQDILTDWTLSMWLKVKYIDKPEYYDGDISSISQFDGEVGEVLSNITTNLIASHKNAILLHQTEEKYQIVLHKFGEGTYSFNALIPLGEWIFISLVGKKEEVKLYINGIYEESIKVNFNCPMYRIGTGMNGCLRQIDIILRELNNEEISNKYSETYSSKQETLSKGQKILLDQGIQTLVWIRTNMKGRFPTKEEWKDCGFTGVTYYDIPMYNESFHRNFPNVKWSMAAAPYGNTMWGTPIEAPKKNEHFLSDIQQQNIKNLISICFGDEEYYSEERVDIFKQWFEISKRLYKDVIVHNNIYKMQWTEHQLRYFVRKAKPDMLTFDTYYYHKNAQGNEFNTIVDSTNDIRMIALEGHDGTGLSPIPFGQYLQGFRTGERGALAGDYLITESQINLVAFISIAMGAKWLNYFRWEYDPETFILFDREGNKTNSFYYCAKICKNINNLSPHLVRLTSTNVKVIEGYHTENNLICKNKLPKTIQPINWELEEYFYKIDVKNLEFNNNRLPGDILIGYFEPLKGLQEEEKELLVSNSKYFMIVNGLADAIRGGSKDNKQEIDIYFKNIEKLYKINNENGKVEILNLEEIGNSIYKYSFIIDGGLGNLFAVC
ncbi:MAG: LamG domain-containing protein [Vallitalea sp.]|jgi:hypothetical protein|nr:LamG domain-containing protein [Vallitalea sp.]